MSQATIIRPLSIHEASFPVFASLSPGAGNVVSIMVLKKRIDHAALLLALGILQDAYPVLKMSYKSVTNSATGYAWLDGAGELAVERTLVENIDDFNETVTKCAEIRLNYPLIEGKPQAIFDHVTSHDKSAIIFCASHAALDGSSFYTINKNLLQILNGNKLEKISSPLPSLWESMPEDIKSRLGFLKTIPLLTTLAKLQSHTNKGNFFKVEIPAPATEHRSIWEKREISKDQFKRIISTSKDKGISVHGLVGAATLLALLTHLRAENRCHLMGERSLPLVTTMDLRRRLNPQLDKNAVGCLSSGVTHLVSIPKNASINNIGSLMDIAKSVENSLSEEINKNQHWKILRLYQTLGMKGMKKTFKSAAEATMSTPITLANFGKLDFDVGNHAEVERVDIIPAFHCTGPAINVITNAIDNSLFLSFCAATPQISRNTLSAYANLVISVLAAI